MATDLDCRTTLAFAAAVSLAAGLARGNVSFVGGPIGVPVANVNDAGIVITSVYDAGATPTLTNVAWGDAGTSIALEHPDNADRGETVTTQNDAGTVIGYAVLNDPVYGNEQRALRWDSPAATPVVLDGLLNEAIDQGAIANAINSNGLIVGAASGFDPSGTAIVDRAAYWPSGSNTPIALGSLGSGAGVADIADAVNNAGTIVGRSAGHAVRWDSGSAVPTALGELGTDDAGTSSSTAVAINRGGTSVGSSSKFEPDTHRPDGERPVRWETGQSAATELNVPSEGLAHGYYTDAGAFAINNAGTAIGGYSFYNDDGERVATHALRWRAGTTSPSVLAPIAGNGFDQSVATAINASGTVVGLSYGSGVGGDTHAVMWSDAIDAAIDLNVYLPADGKWLLLEDAISISDTGFVTGYGMFDADADGPNVPDERSFRLLIPAAGTYGLGDATFDTKIDFADLLVLAKHYGQATGGSIHDGDFDLNGTVAFADLLTLAKHYGTSPASVLAATGDTAFANDWALAQALVPEPASLLALLGGASLAARRRRTISGSKSKRSR